MATPADAELIDLFGSYDGRQLDVHLRHGAVSPVFNIAWGYDMGDPYAHVTTNISPGIDGQPTDFFFTYAVVAVLDHLTGTELYRSESNIDHERVFGNWTRTTIKKLLGEGDPHVLPHIPIIISMDPPDCQWALSLCLALSRHGDTTVRGNSILGFGHLARNCPGLDLSPVAPILHAALDDPQPYIRGQADAARDDIEHYHLLELVALDNEQPSFRRRGRT